MPEAILLGVAQDAGVPQIGCDCRTCTAARAGSGELQLPVSLGLIDPDARSFWMIDATPAFARQYDMLRGRATGCGMAGLLLTHAHMGHYVGLAQLGKEALNARGVPVLCTPAMAAFVRSNEPWAQLVLLGNIVLRELPTASEPAFIDLSPALRVAALPVPHRNELSDTVAYLIEGARRRLLYVPDIDRWDGFAADLGETLRALRVDVALVDGCFYSQDELPRMAQVPHPLVIDTMERLSSPPCEVTFIHLNHTNPLYTSGFEQARVISGGFHVGRLGQSWDL